MYRTRDLVSQFIMCILIPSCLCRSYNATGIGRYLRKSSASKASHLLRLCISSADVNIIIACTHEYGAMEPSYRSALTMHAGRNLAVLRNLNLVVVM